MKLVGIGDLYIPAKMIMENLPDLSGHGIEVAAVDWPLKGYDELQAYNLKIETSGPAAVDLPDRLVEHLAEADIILTHFGPLSRGTMQKCTQLKLIGVMRVGVGNVDTDEARARNITVLNTPGRNAHAVADFTVGLMLAESRNIARAHAALKQARWRKDFINWNYMPELGEKTVGIIGFGAIGRLVAKKLSGFGVKILAYDPFVNPADLGGIPQVKLCGLDELLRESDFVTIHARLTDASRALINRENIQLMKKTSYLINTSRAEIVEELALREALEQRWITGAALDVFYGEPPLPTDWILELDNVTLTPHMAGSTYDAYRNSVKLLGERLRLHLETEGNLLAVQHQRR